MISIYQKKLKILTFLKKITKSVLEKKKQITKTNTSKKYKHTNASSKPDTS